MIQNYDSNGLVFALHPTAVNEDFSSESYQQAILNILNAQKFHCIPLVNRQIIRDNTNNLKDRAVYKTGGGEVTHIARKPRYTGEQPLEFIPISDITHVENELDLIEGVIQLFSHQENKVCNFIISVGGTPKSPTALFTLRELLLDKTRNELFLRMAKKGIESSDKGLTKCSYLIYTQLTELDQNQNWDEVKNVTSKIISELEKIPKSIAHHNSRKSDLIDSGDFADLKVKDIMTSAACGVEINTENKVLNLAIRILCMANDFDRLVVYYNAKLNPEKVIVKSKQTPAKSITAKTEDSIRSVIKQSNENRSKDFYAIVEPDHNIITGEGPMVWPGFLTIKELRSAKALLSYAATCGMIEFQMIKYMQAHGIQEIPMRFPNRQPKPKPIQEATVGQIVRFLRESKAPGQSFNEIFDVFKNQITIDKLGDFVDIRNGIIHESLIACFGKEIGPEKISIQNLQLIYKIAECLKVYD